MAAETVLVLLGLAVLTTCSVGAWTLRVSVAAAGRRVAAAGIAAAEGVLFVVVFGTVVSSLDDPVRVGGYAAGVAGGTWLGILVEERFSTGQSMVRLVVDGSGHDEAAALRGRLRHHRATALHPSRRLPGRDAPRAAPPHGASAGRLTGAAPDME